MGEPVSYKTYFSGNLRTHMVGVLGGIVWGLGTVLSYIAAGKAGAAISYALGPGAPMIAALTSCLVRPLFSSRPCLVFFILSV